MTAPVREFICRGRTDATHRVFRGGVDRDRAGSFRARGPGGPAAVRTFHWKVPVSALAPHRDLLAAEFLERPPHTTAEACERIEQLTGVRRGESRVREFMPR